MRITNLRASTSDGMWRCEADIQWESPSRPDRTVYFDVPENRSKDLVATIEPFLLAAAVPALAAGESEIVTNDSICPQLAANIRFCLKMLQTWNPTSLGTHPTPQIVAPVRQIPLFDSGERQAGQFFSGGVDSWHLLLNNATDFPHGHPGRVANLIPVYGFDIGGRERDGDQRYTFRELLETVGPIADSMGLKTLPVFTNLRHLDDTPGFWGDQFVGFALAAVAYLLRSNTNPVYVASTGDPLSVEGQPPQGAHPLTAWPLRTYP